MPGRWAVMYLCVRGFNVASLKSNDFAIVLLPHRKTL
jgi:hypothetical protein